jgi:hypothetical protein
LNITIRPLITFFNKYNFRFRKINQHRRKFTFQYDYFEKIDSEEKAYWLGFILADGCIFSSSENNKKLRICISKKDEQILKNFCNSIHLSKEAITEVPTVNAVAVKLTSTKLYYDLTANGVRENKTKFGHGIPIFSQDLTNHFIRGYFDGDGSCFVTKAGSKRVSILGHKDFLEWIIIQFNKFNIKANKISSHKNGAWYEYHFSNRHDVILTYQYLYKNASLYLKRKKLKFEV